MTISRNRVSALALLLATLMLALGVHTAYAASTGAAVVVGGGTLSPGISATPQTQTYAFGGNAVIVTDTVQGLATCNFGGSSSAPESILTGGGTLSGSCSGAGISTSCSIAFTRVGVAVLFDATCSGNPSGSAVGTAQFAPTNPTGTSYQAVAELVFVNP